MKIQRSIDIHSLIQKLNDFAKSFPQVKWGSSSHGIPISVAAGLLGAAGLVLAVKDGQVRNFLRIGQSWDDGPVASEKSWVVPGLRNLGNNCFLNVILQALASCSSFRRYLEDIFKECDFSSIQGSDKKLALTSALASLLEELCVVQDGRSALNPQKLMVAMEHYMPSFSLTRQQDAEEAFYHLLSSLREELSGCYISNHSSWADVTALSSSRILTPKARANKSELKRWKHSFLGPFNGILGSILTCQSCKFQISLDFQLFHSLHLLPKLSGGRTIMAGCSLEDCLKQYFVSERLEDYFCNHCWHAAAIKYISFIGENEADIEILQQCNEDDSCQCKDLSSIRVLPWSNSFSRSFRQLSMPRSPQILCLHLQRASVNVFGDLVKLLGHISFPLILDLSPFVKSRVGIKNPEENSRTERSRVQYQLPLPHTDCLSMQFDTDMLNCNRHTGRDISLEAEMGEHQQTPFGFTSNIHALKTQPKLSENGSYADSVISNYLMHSSDKVAGPSPTSPSRDHIYRLVSVVEHFGNVGSGHYTVYRRVTAETNDDDPIALLEPAHAQWFCISDSEVHSVSEKDVLDAEASLLFYEKIKQTQTTLCTRPS